MEELFSQPILEYFKTIKAHLFKISFHHIYREFKAEANGLSKEGLLVRKNCGLAWEIMYGLGLQERSLQKPPV